MPATTTAPDLHDLQRTLRELSDRAEIAALVAKLGRWLDERRFDETRDVLAEEIAVSTPGGTAKGIDAVVAQARRNHAVARTQHRITDVLIELDGDRASVGANLAVVFVPDAAAPERHRTLGERYAFEAVRTDAGWRLARIAVTPLWVREAAG